MILVLGTSTCAQRLLHHVIDRQHTIVGKENSGSVSRLDLCTHVQSRPAVGTDKRPVSATCQKLPTQPFACQLPTSHFKEMAGTVRACANLNWSSQLGPIRALGAPPAWVLAQPLHPLPRAVKPGGRAAA